MFCWRLSGLLHVQLDILLQVQAQVAVGADHHGEAVVARLGRGGEFELHLLLSDQAGHLIGRRYQAVRLSITDIHPPVTAREARLETALRILLKSKKKPGAE